MNAHILPSCVPDQPGNPCTQIRTPPSWLPATEGESGSASGDERTADDHDMATETKARRTYAPDVRRMVAQGRGDDIVRTLKIFISPVHGLRLAPKAAAARRLPGSPGRNHRTAASSNPETRAPHRDPDSRHGASGDPGPDCQADPQQQRFIPSHAFQ